MMKRICTLFLCFVVVFAFVSCKSEEASRVDKMIDDIGTVTLESDEAISEAEHAVVSLDPEDREQLENVDKLKEKRKEHKELVYQEKAKNVEAMIDDIGEVTLADTKKVEKVRVAYDALPKEAEAYVSNYDVLLKAENRLSDLRAENVINLIDNIGKVTKGSEKKIKEAEDAYNALSSDEKEKVTNIAKLREARSELTSIKKKDVEKKKDNAISKLNKKYDAVEDITWYEASTQPQYVDLRCYVLPYIGVKGDDAWLCLYADYTGDDWIFYDKLIINADGTIYTKECSSSNINTDHKNGIVWEYYNASAVDKDLDWLRAIANADNAVVRFSGDYTYDLVISDSDKKAIGQVLDAYEAISEYTMFETKEIINSYG